MEFNEYIRWFSKDLEQLEEAIEGCQRLHYETTNPHWIATAKEFERRADGIRMVAAAQGWYLV